MAKYIGKILVAIWILSPILLMFGFLYLLGGAHPNEWDNNALLRVFPNIPAGLIVPFPLLWFLILQTLTANGRFGLWLITLAYTMRSYYAARTKTRIRNTVSAVSGVIIAALVVWHLLLVIVEGQSFVEGVVYFVLSVVVCRIFGAVFGKLIHFVSTANTLTKRILWAVAIVVVLIVLNILTARIPTPIIKLFE